MQIAILIVGILAPIFAAFGAAILTARWNTYAASRKAKALQKARQMYDELQNKGKENREKYDSISRKNEQRIQSASLNLLDLIYRVIHRYIILFNLLRLRILDIKYNHLNSKFIKHNAIIQEDYKSRRKNRSSHVGLHRPPSVESSLSSISRQMRQNQKKLYDSNTNIPQ